MKAMVFAAGRGTRLRPLTDSLPKALAPVGDRPALQHVLEHIKSLGIKDVVVNVHHFPEMICRFLSDNDNFGLNISISDESDLLLDTGGGLLKALPLLGDEDAVLLHNADIWTDADLGRMIEIHSATDAGATLLAWERDSSRRLLFDPDGRMAGWCNLLSLETRPAGLDIDRFRPLAFGGVHIISPSMFPLLEDYGKRNGNVFSITPFYIDACRCAAINAYSPASDFHWFDIGRPESLRQASEFVLSTRNKKDR